MRKEDLKNWTREQMKGEILRLHRKLELFSIKFEENPNNFSFSHHGNRYYAGKLVNDYVALKEENSLIKSEYNDAINSFTSVSIDNENLRRRIAKLESDICGTSPCIVSEFHSFEGESWIKATTYDDVLLRLKKANERITDLEQDRFNKSTEELKQAENLSSENKSLKDENKALKQQNEYLKSIFESMSPPESPEIVMRKTGMFSEEEIQAHMRANKKIWEDMENTVSENAINKDALIADFQDQHQQDCIRINDLTTTVHVLAGLYSALRKNMGMD